MTRVLLLSFVILSGHLYRSDGDGKCCFRVENLSGNAAGDHFSGILGNPEIVGNLALVGEKSGIGYHLWRVYHLGIYLGPLSLAIPLWAGAMSTGYGIVNLCEETAPLKL